MPGARGKLTLTLLDRGENVQRPVRVLLLVVEGLVAKVEMVAFQEIV